MTTSPRFLTKSRFKLALECPTKLFYTGKPAYLNKSLDDSFLQALAEGGYQVGALACLMVPGGERIDELGHTDALDRTRVLLARDEVTIYEAAFEAQGLFVRVDVLRKRGNVIELIEVKAKSYRPDRDAGFRGSNGQLRPDFLPYLQDIAFQRHVAGLAFPQFEYRCFLMMADTSLTASVDGLNQRFPIRRASGRTEVVIAPGTDAGALGEPVLTAVAVDDAVAEILVGDLEVAGQPMPFAEAVRHLADAYSQDRRIDPVPGTACASCEFKAAAVPGPDEPRSGFHECWADAFGWQPADFERGTVLDLWNFRKKADLISRRVLKPRDVSAQDIGFTGDPLGDEGMSPKHRQWYQCSGQWPGGSDFYLDREGLLAGMRGWRYPLHFIDFETCSVAIPFNRGHRPYETVAFQFSHHVMQADGRVAHRTQFLSARPGRDPNIDFVRALRNALSGDGGTVFRWAAHENTVLNQLRRQLMVEAHPPADRDALVAFIESITTRKEGKAEIAGPRNMVDLCKLAERHFFHPATKGSSSLKKVLPTLMASSDFLRETYGAAVYGSASMPSLNLAAPVAWWVERDGAVCDPYRLLPPVFAGLSPEQQEALDAGVADELHDGGAAMAAYARLQFEQISDQERKAIEASLLKYCELDTLAMVMAVQAWKAWLAVGVRPGIR